MSCRDPARACEYLVNRGRSHFTDKSHADLIDKRINSIMLTYGVYDAVRNFSYNMGLPAKRAFGVALCRLRQVNTPYDPLVHLCWGYIKNPFHLRYPLLTTLPLLGGVIHLTVA